MNIDVLLKSVAIANERIREVQGCSSKGGLEECK